MLHRLHSLIVLTLVFLVTAVVPPQSAEAASGQDEQTIKLRAWGVPTGFGTGPLEDSKRMVIDAFRKQYPHIEPVPTTGLTLPGSRTTDMVPFMQIAGDLAPDVLFVNFRQSHTYITMKLLHPLDDEIERKSGITLQDGSSLPNSDYLAALKRGSNWDAMPTRDIERCLPIMRRSCPFGEKCPYREGASLPAKATHWHVWTYPVGPLAMAMQFDRSLLAEHANEGIELRTPTDWEELLRWAKILTNPAENSYGLDVSINVPGFTYANFLYSAGGRIVEQAEDGNWYCAIDSPAAVEAAYFWARLRHEKVIRNGQEIARGVVRASSEGAVGGPTRFGFRFSYIDDRFFNIATDQTKGMGPSPAGPTGIRRGEFNSIMLGIFSGLAANPARRQAAWDYIDFYDGDAARKIRTEVMVEAGLGPYVRRELLERFNEGGRYDSIIRRIPPGLVETYNIAFSGGEPEPYGKNCQYVYDELSKPLGAIWNSASIRDAIDAGDAEAAKSEIRGILQRANARINQKMLGNLTREERSTRERVAWIAIATVVVVFALVLRAVFRAFTPPELRKERTEAARSRGRWGLVASIAGGADTVKRGDADASRPVAATPAIEVGAGEAVPVQGPSWIQQRYLRAWMLMAPALVLIAVWSYWPVLRGTVIAFQNYSVLGDSEYVGAANFATVLYSAEFWYSLRISLTYAALFFVFGFWAPIGLALLLSEVPRGGIFFRTVYYMPAVLSGVVVIFLWKSFYGSSGMVNQILNGIVWALNLLPGVQMSMFNQDWLQDPQFVIFFCLLPTVWAGMGPGCLIYLAALKTIPESIYEAADIDGAGIRHKLFSITLPSIRMLIMINFIGAMIGAIRGAGGFMLAMTGGGPYGELGGATEVIGLKIFYTTFGYLQFGVGAAMAWVLGAMLIGFTVIQLKRMSNLEFRTAKV